MSFGHIYLILFFLSPYLGDGQISTEILSQNAVKPKTTNQPIFKGENRIYFIECVEISIILRARGTSEISNVFNKGDEIFLEFIDKKYFYFFLFSVAKIAIPY